MCYIFGGLFTILALLSKTDSEALQKFKSTVIQDLVSLNVYRTVNDARKLTECVHFCKLDSSCQHVNFNKDTLACGYIGDDIARQDLPSLDFVLTTQNGNNFVKISADLESVPIDCEGYGITSQGIHEIKPAGAYEPFYVQCDNGWTVIQNHFDDSIDFSSKLWQDYKLGFGNLNEEFWLGLENMHLLTNQASYTILLEIDLYDGTHVIQDFYTTFSVSDEANWYQLAVTTSSTDAYIQNQLPGVNGRYFTTRDQDHDVNANTNCAIEKSAGWWYQGCSYLNLNSPIPTSMTQCPSSQGSDLTFCMKMWKGGDGSTPLKRSVMKIKRI